jgi:putative DNA primase/helicase
MQDNALGPLASERSIGSISDGFEHTDVGNAQRLINRHGAKLRYIHDLRRWLVWDGRRWATARLGEPDALAKETARSILLEAAAADGVAQQGSLSRWGIQSQSAPRVRAMLELARSEPGIPLLPEALDTQPSLLNVGNGVLDLETGQLSAHDPRWLITKQTPVAFDPDAESPRWESWLEQMLGGDTELKRYIQQLAGLCLSGHTTEAIFIFFGSGANGKSTFIETLMDLLGDYAVATRPETLMRGRSDRGGADPAVVALRGARLVTATEPQEGSRLNEGLVKAMVGGDTVSARPLFGDPVTFRPTFKLVIGTNHRPLIDGTDDGIWRRVKIVPWSATIDEGRREEDFRARWLVPELPGILSWAVRGYADWRANGSRLAEPALVTSLVRAYRGETDTVEAFISARCDEVAGSRLAAGELYDAYVAWAQEQAVDVLSNQRFSRAMQQRGAVKAGRLPSGRIAWDGLTLRRDGRDS